MTRRLNLDMSFEGLICGSDFGMLSLLGKNWNDYFVRLTLEAVFIVY